MDEANKVQVHVDEEVCVGSGTCAMVDPDHFRLVEGKGRAAAGPVDRTEDLDDAVQDCPVQAIVSTRA